MNIKLTDAPPAPCMKCVDRKVGCHSKCKKYIEWAEVNERIKESNVDKYRANTGWSYIKRRKNDK